MHVHLENTTSKPRPFWLTPELVDAARSSDAALPGDVRFTVGSDLQDIAGSLSTATALVTSAGVICDLRFPRRELAVAAPHLQFIHLIDAGVEDVMPLNWLPSNVQLINNSGVHAEKAREFAIMSLLALNARLPEIVGHQRRAQWEQVFTPLIRGKSLLVIGLGDMGQAAVAAGRTLGMKVLGVRRSGMSVPGVERVYLPSQLQDAVELADFIVIATPLTSGTRNLVDRSVLEAAKPAAALLNIGRAEVLDHGALVDLLKNGRLSGAILDVLPQEPLPSSSELWSCPNLMINPHVGADDPTTYMTETMRLLFANLRQHLTGRPLQNVVDRMNEY
ncbi:phosphoglycerate dehydrogenase-like enzyme [Paraburkholderia sp. UCT70]|uniref:D-2-hydroxyacid dehydrogenase n=1 Tax=Paraburkholderia sp. UCT70 TaxID=2991068 RepID=UPI003D24ABB0